MEEQSWIRARRAKPIVRESERVVRDVNDKGTAAVHVFDCSSVDLLVGGQESGIAAQPGGSFGFGVACGTEDVFLGVKADFKGKG